MVFRGTADARRRTLRPRSDGDDFLTTPDGEPQFADSDTQSACAHRHLCRLQRPKWP